MNNTLEKSFIVLSDCLSDEFSSIISINAERKNFMQNHVDPSFDEIIGHIEDILMGKYKFI